MTLSELIQNIQSQKEFFDVDTQIMFWDGHNYSKTYIISHYTSPTGETVLFIWGEYLTNDEKQGLGI